MEQLIKHLMDALMRENHSDRSHGMAHVQRVWKNAQAISATMVNVDIPVLMAATFLHDIVNLPKNHPDRKQASRLSAERAGVILKELNFPDEKVTGVQHAILAHSFSAGMSAETIEAKILQDADRLDAIGALGIARCFYVAGQMGSELYSESDPMALNRDLDDKTYALDHFEQKLFKVPSMMQTNAGKEMAVERVERMKQFVAALRKEI